MVESRSLAPIPFGGLRCRNRRRPGAGTGRARGGHGAGTGAGADIGAVVTQRSSLTMRAMRPARMTALLAVSAVLVACSSSTPGSSAAPTTLAASTSASTESGGTSAGPASSVLGTAPAVSLGAPTIAAGSAGSSAASSVPTTGPAVTTGCDQLTNGTHTIEIAGVARQFQLYVPAALSFMRRPLPLMVLFHGYNGTATEIAADTRLDQQAVNAGVVLAVPQGVDSPTSWHVDGSFGDNDFIDALLRQLTSASCIDRANVWLAGFSAGSAFTGVYGCAHAAQFAGLVMVSGLPPAICPDKNSPIIQISHGLADQVVPFNGGDQVVGNSTVHLDPVPISAAAWAARAGCAVSAAVALVGEASNASTWSGCTRGQTVSLVAVTGLGHAWPGAPAPAGQAATVPVVDPGCVALKTMTNSPDDVDAACLFPAG